MYPPFTKKRRRADALDVSSIYMVIPKRAGLLRSKGIFTFCKLYVCVEVAYYFLHEVHCLPVTGNLQPATDVER